MPDLLTPLKTVSSVKSRIGALENVMPKDGGRAPNDSQGREGRPLIEIAQKLRSENVETVKEELSIRSKSSSTINGSFNDSLNGSFRRGHKRIDSTAFLKQTYLGSPTTYDLSDDAHEILKSQPDREDLLSVLQYLQYGIERKHDFNIRAPSAKSSQITNALVGVTVVDHWHHLRGRNLSQEDKQLKRCLLFCLTSVTGLGALLAQIKKLSSRTAGADGEHALTRDMVSVLEHILARSSTLYDLIKDTLNATDKPGQRHVVWQELVSFLAGSKILTIVAQSSADRKVEEDVDDASTWLGEGPRYCLWLAKNIAHAATTLHVKETESWSMLALLTRRGFSLGNRGT